jgi:DnaK suppressor protein
MSQDRNTFIDICKKKLLEAKEELFNRRRQNQIAYARRDKHGDDVDNSMNTIAEHQFIVFQEHIRTQLLDIEKALGRIERGTFGICEETEEPIEKERLLTIPWTPLSIEGAEIRESLKRRYSKG